MTLQERIEDIRNGLETNRFPNEAAVSQGIVLPMLRTIGWPTDNPTIVYPEYPVRKAKARVDFALCLPPSEPRVFIEVKQVGNIEGGEEQLFRYALREGVPIAILTDGRRWQFFYVNGRGNYEERKVPELDLLKADVEESARCLNRYLNYKSIETGEAITAIEADYHEIVKQREIKTRLPEAWEQLVKEGDEFLLHVVSEKVESLCEYKPTKLQVLGFLKSLKMDEASPVIMKEDEDLTESTTRPPGHPTQLIVTMDNGETINHSYASRTFAEVIEKLGIERVRELGHIVNGIPLISPTKHEKYTPHKYGRYYIVTATSTAEKSRLLKKIADQLGVSLTVKIVPRRTYSHRGRF